MKTSRRKFFNTGLSLAAGIGLHRNTSGQTLYGEDARKKIKDVPEKKKATMDLMEFQPRSTLVVPEHKVTRSKFPCIDTHTHMCDVFGRRRGDKPATPLPGAEEYIAKAVKTMDGLNLQTIVNLTGGNGEELVNKIARLDRKYPGRFMTCTQPDYLRINEPGYPQWQADELRRARDAGAVGLKILKGHGLTWRKQIDKGPLIKIDDPRFDPMWEACGELGMPVFIHTSDPDAFFMPIDRFNERWEELGNHPDWSFYGEDYPSKPELLAARNRVIERHPGTNFIGLHVANHPENLDEVATWLDKYPNLYCDTAARLGELGRQPRRAREFLIKYQDRICWGTDATPTVGTPQQDFKPAMFHAYFRFAETWDEYFDYAPSPTPPQGRWKIYGVNLPDEVLKKFYYNNIAGLLGMKLI